MALVTERLTEQELLSFCEFHGFGWAHYSTDGYLIACGKDAGGRCALNWRAISTDKVEAWRNSMKTEGN